MAFKPHEWASYAETVGVRYTPSAAFIAKRQTACGSNREQASSSRLIAGERVS